MMKTEIKPDIFTQIKFMNFIVFLYIYLKTAYITRKQIQKICIKV